jgi:hypothetical protein
MVPSWVVVTALLWLVVVIVSFFLFKKWDAFEDFFPTKLGPLPVGVVWFGAAGGLLVSLEGIFYYNRAWDDSYNYWHVSRPAVSAIVGGVGCLILIVLIDAASAGSHAPHTNEIFYDVVAFALGYRQQTFLALLAGLTELIVKTAGGDKKDGAAGEEPKPPDPRVPARQP